MNFNSIYENIKNNIMKNIDNIKNKSVVNENEIDENITQTDNIEAIGGAVEEALTEQNTIVEDNNIQTPEEPQEVQLSQEEIEIDTIKKTANFIKPIEGTISSGFGQREPTTSTVPKNHTGVDIAANMGTKIKASTDGEVVLASEEGDYGKHLKIQIGSVSIIYAHCNNLYVNQGDKVIQGQEIAEVGSTGNSTGPHLHFEIRLSEKAIDPQKILEL